MKTIRLHPMSALSGVLLTTLVVLASGAQSRTAIPIPTRDVQVVGHIPAEWWTYFELKTDSNGQMTTPPYVVPDGQFFVATLMQPDTATFQVNGQRVDHLWVLDPNPGGTNIADKNGTRIAFPPGTVITLESASTQGQFWGYLEPVR